MSSSAHRATIKELFQAAQHNDFTAAREYLHTVFDEVKQNGNKAKHAIIKTLVEQKTGNSLLHYACDNGNLDACKYLLMCDGMADTFLNEPNAFGHTPLFYAASNGTLSLVKYLISNGADIDIDYSDREDIEPREGDEGIFTPLQIACFRGHKEIVDFLVECNAMLSGTRRNGKTPLHFACMNNHKSIVSVLMEAGADVHACDDQGKSPVDLASAILLPILLPDKYVGHENANDEDGLETNADDDDDDEEDVNDKGAHKVSIDLIRSTLGNDIIRDFRHKSWKIRVNAITDTTNRIQNSTGRNLIKLFDGACHMIVLGLQDAVSQVVSPCCTSLLKTSFNAIMAVPEFHTLQFHQDRPILYQMSDLLLLRGAGSNEKDASEAVASLLFLICKSQEMTRHLTSHISCLMVTPSTGSKVVASPRPGDSSLPTSNSISWRTQLVSIKILNTIASQYRLDPATSGLSFPDAIKISTSALENASVHVRNASIDLLVQCLLIRCERSDMTGSVESIYEQIKSWSDMIFKQQNQVLKPSIQAKINTGLKNAIQNSKRLNTSVTPCIEKESSEGTKQGKTIELTMPLSDINSSGAMSPRTKNAQNDDELPYAEPIQEQYKEQAGQLQSCFGEKITRCLFSNAWAPRVEALSLLQYRVQAKIFTFDTRRHSSTEQLLHAMQNVILLALQDRVNAVYEAGVALLMEFVIVTNASSSSDNGIMSDLIRPLIPRLLTKLGDTKARLHMTTEDALLLLSRQKITLGPEFLLEEIIACDRNASVASLSAVYMTNKLNLISKLLLEVGIKESRDGNGELPIKHVLQPALQMFEHRDPNVRQVALQIIADTMQTARVAAMPYLDALARSLRQKIISKLVEKGVLESDLLMDEVDDFEIPSEPTIRPGTSGGIRPPTASGSSTKHRPALSNASLSSTSTSSIASTSQASPLPYGTALTSEQKTTYAHIIACFGEELVRCLLDKVWAQREAAMREIERLVVWTANGKLSIDKALPKTSETLNILSQCVEMGLGDTVARVFQCTLRVCQLIAIEFMPLIPIHTSNDVFLECTVRAAVQKLGDTKQRLRSDCITLLLSLASLNHIGQARISRILAKEYQVLLEKSSSWVNSSPLVGTELFKVFTVLIRDGYASSSSLNHPDLGPILELMLVAFENKHVDVRHAAIDAYGAIYEVTNGGTSVNDLDLVAFMDRAKPTIRELMTRKVMQFSKSLAATDVSQSDTASGMDSSRQQPLALDINKLRHVCSQDIVDLLISPKPASRRLGVDRLMQIFVDSPRDLKFKGAWEICCLLIKQLLLDGTPSVCLAAFQLLRLLIAPTQITPEYAIPWGEWGVHLILGSTVRSVMQQCANTSVRVRTHVRGLLELIASKHVAGKNAVCNAILSAPEQQDLSNEQSKRVRKVALCKLRWQMMIRLDLVYELMQDKPSNSILVAAPAVNKSSTGPGALNRRKSSSGSKSSESLSTESIVPFLGSCIVHPSPQIRAASRKIMAVLKSTRLEEVTKFMSEECSPSLQRRLHALLADEDNNENGNNAHTDHFNADDTTAVRGSRASHVRRIAALRPPRTVPNEEKSMSVDIFPPPHSAPGKSRRALATEEDDEDEFGDYVVQPKSKREVVQSTPQKSTQVNKQQSSTQVPIWLDQAPRKTSGNSNTYSDPHNFYPDTSEPSMTAAAVGGGAAKFVKVRRKSSMRGNNDMDDYAPLRSTQ